MNLRRVLMVGAMLGFVLLVLVIFAQPAAAADTGRDW